MLVLKQFHQFLSSCSDAVYSEYDLFNLQDENHERWLTRTGLNMKAYLRHAQKAGLRRITLDSPKYGRVVRYAKSTASNFQVGLSLRRGGYISHESAAFLHGLAQGSARIYINKEQSPKRALSEITQHAVDRAFANPPRESSLRYRETNSAAGIEYVLLNGKNTGNWGVITLTHPIEGSLSVTGVERTLIDMAVRPQYGGGLVAVLKAFRKAHEAQLAKAGGLFQSLQQLDHKYPYHQSIGFLIDKAGFAREDSQIFKHPGLKLDFYLGHAIDKPLYDPEWRIYYPRDLHNPFSTR